MAYFCSYSACRYIPSGIVGLLGSLMIIPSYVLGIIAKEYYSSSKMVIILIISVGGLILISKINILDIPPLETLGIIFSFASIFSSALGYVLVRKMSATTDLSVLAIAALSTGTSGLATLAYAFVKHGRFEFSSDTNFLVNLLLLGVILTPFVYVCLYYLSAKFSTIHTSYVFAIAPVVSIILSIFIEGYAPTILNYTGIVIILLSSVMAQRKVLDLKITPS